MCGDEYWLALVACAGVLVFGTPDGILTAILVSVGLLLWKMNRPPIARLGLDPTSGSYRDLARNPEPETLRGS